MIDQSQRSNYAIHCYNHFHNKFCTICFVKAEKLLSQKLLKAKHGKVYMATKSLAITWDKFIKF